MHANDRQPNITEIVERLTQLRHGYYVATIEPVGNKFVTVVAQMVGMSTDDKHLILDLLSGSVTGHHEFSLRELGITPMTSKSNERSAKRLYTLAGGLDPKTFDVHDRNTLIARYRDDVRRIQLEDDANQKAGDVLF